MDYAQESLKRHRELRGKIELALKAPLENKDDLSTFYTPGVAEPCRAIAKDPEEVWNLTPRGNWVAVVTDGSSVLGLGNIGPEAGFPVMAGKAMLFKTFGGVDAFPICLATQNVDEIVETVKRIAPSFGGINLEDISAPRCFEIERRLKEELDIPVMHDDQHGTAIVVLAGLINACKVTGRALGGLRVVVNGSGAAGVAITKLLLSQGVKDIVVVDSKGIVSSDRDNLNPVKEELLSITNPEDLSGSLADAIKDRDVFIGVSGAPNIVDVEMLRSMNNDPIVFAMGNPDPEVLPDVAKEGGVRVMATGRSDFPNQINNVLAFPGIFRGALDARIKNLTPEMFLAAAHALAEAVEQPTEDHIIPDPFDSGVASRVAKAVVQGV